ncbi:hypothetical protein B0H14DRAFT_2600989 [Mycena olivaceomarginata]|nr:hypothetical protein B0H14DRAFT_2600989 [Mycena olivaceomarginata]
MSSLRRRRSPGKTKRRASLVTARTVRYRKRVLAATARESRSSPKPTQKKDRLGNRSWLGCNPHGYSTEAFNIWKIACRVRVWDFFNEGLSSARSGRMFADPDRLPPFPFTPAWVLRDLESGAVLPKGTPIDPVRRAAWTMNAAAMSH